MAVSFIYWIIFDLDLLSKLFKFSIIVFNLWTLSFFSCSFSSLSWSPPNILINPSSFSFLSNKLFNLFNFSSCFGVLLFSFKYSIISFFLSLSNLFIIFANLFIDLSSLSLSLSLSLSFSFSLFFSSSWLNISFIFFFWSSFGIMCNESYSILSKNSFSSFSLFASHKSTILFNISFFFGFLFFSITWFMPSFFMFRSTKQFSLLIWTFLTSLSELSFIDDITFFFCLLFFNPFTNLYISFISFSL